MSGVSSDQTSLSLVLPCEVFNHISCPKCQRRTAIAREAHEGAPFRPLPAAESPCDADGGGEAADRGDPLWRVRWTAVGRRRGCVAELLSPAGNA